MKILSWVAGVFITATFIVGLSYIEATPQKIAKPEFVPGQRVVIHIGNSTIKGVVDEQRVNRALKGDRLVRTDGEPMEERLFHTAETR